jgi:hypothetical protein
VSKWPITDEHIAQIKRDRCYHWMLDDGWVRLARGLEDKLAAAQAEVAALKTAGRELHRLVQCERITDDEAVFSSTAWEELDEEVCHD